MHKSLDALSACSDTCCNCSEPLQKDTACFKAEKVPEQRSRSLLCPLGLFHSHPTCPDFYSHTMFVLSDVRDSPFPELLNHMLGSWFEGC